MLAARRKKKLCKLQFHFFIILSEGPLWEWNANLPREKCYSSGVWPRANNYLCYFPPSNSFGFFCCKVFYCHSPIKWLSYIHPLFLETLLLGVRGEARGWMSRKILFHWELLNYDVLYTHGKKGTETNVNYLTTPLELFSASMPPKALSFATERSKLQILPE